MRCKITKLKHGSRDKLFAAINSFCLVMKIVSMLQIVHDTECRFIQMSLSKFCCRYFILDFVSNV
jgi:hypothetical protein